MTSAANTQRQRAGQSEVKTHVTAEVSEGCGGKRRRRQIQAEETLEMPLQIDMWRKTEI